MEALPVAVCSYHASSYPAPLDSCENIGSQNIHVLALPPSLGSLGEVVPAFLCAPLTMSVHD
jgi:hypothetical protein